MTKLLRQIILGIVLTLSLIILGAILFYNSGHRFDWETETIQVTGSIMVNTQPKSVVVTLHPGTVKTTSPNTINQLDPGRYTVRFSEPGYIPRQVTATVIAGQATILNDIVLWPNLKAKPTTINVISSNLTTVNLPSNLQFNSDTKIFYADEQALSRDVMSVDWDKTNQSVLLVKNFELDIYHPATHEFTTILRQSTPIQSALWYQSTGWYIIYATSKEVRVIDSRLTLGQSNTLLYSGNNITTLQLAESGKNLIITDDAQNLTLALSN